MGSPVTLSGFNNIDFNLILSSIMTQESQPLVALQSRQASLQSKASAFGSLSNRVAALQSAVAKLSNAADLAATKATSSDNAAVSVSSTSGAAPGRYDVVVQELARAQVTASTTVAPDPDSTIVASGGTLTIGGVTVTLTGATTLRQLADAINASSTPPARASVVQSGPSSYRLVLSAKDTGEANAFTVRNNLTGGTGVAFGDADGDGLSGDDAADNAQQASDASLLVNNIPIKSTTNTIATAIPGVTITAFRKDPAATVSVDVSNDSTGLKDNVKAFVTAYNDLARYATDQAALAGKNDPASIGRDPVMTQIKSQLRMALSSEYATGGVFSALSQVGVEFTRTGQLTLNETAFGAAASKPAELEKIFVGTTATPGAFRTLDKLLDTFTTSDGLLPGARRTLTDQASRLTDSIARMQDRLAVRRAALQKEFTAADMAMSQLKSQSGSLAQFGASI